MAVIQGFDIKPELKIKISIDDEVYASLKHLTDQALQQDPKGDEIMEAMTSDDKTPFLDFVHRAFTAQAQQLIQDYRGAFSPEEVLTSMGKAFDKYTSTSGKFKLPLP